MVVVGGYVGTQLECDSPGIYIFNLSSLSWQNTYVALEGANTLNNQKSQENDPAALQGSYGYEVPEAVQSVIGGNSLGKATVTSPAQSAAQGPLATGKPVTYTVTGSNGAVATETAISGGPGSGSGGNSSGNNNNNTGAIVAGVIAGCFALLSAYLAFCAWIYRRQLKLYKNHVAMAQRAHLSGDSGGRFLGPVLAAGGKRSNERSSSMSNSNSNRFSDERRAGPYTPVGGPGAAAGLSSNNPYHPNNVSGRAGSARSSTEDLLAGREPSYLGVLLNPRRSLRVVNRD
jgi:hypothetical protein